MIGDRDEFYMRMALREAGEAAREGEVPVGAVLVCGDRLAGKAHNQVERLRDPTAHAEMIAITQAAAALGDWRLEGCTLYVTKEPCAMCAGAIGLARIPRVVWGADDPLRGGVTRFRVLPPGEAGPAVELVPGVLRDECLERLRGFFREAREAARRERGRGLARGGDSG